MTRTLLQLAGLTAISFVAACGGKEEPYDKPLPPVRVATVERQSEPGGARYSANIKPSTQVVLAAKVGGYIRELHHVGSGGEGLGREVQEGDHVATGTVLARIREDDYTAKINQARSTVAEAAAGLEHAKRQFERAQALFARQSLTKPELDGAQAALDAAQAKGAGAKALVEEAELALRDTAIVAPLDAIVLKRMVEVGSLVGPGAPAFVLGDVHMVHAVFGVPDVVLDRFRVGSPLTLTAEALPGQEFKGTIARIAPAAELATRVFEIEVRIANPRAQLKPGMIGTIETQEPAAPVPVVPLSAVVRSKRTADGYAVCLVRAEGGNEIVRCRDVQLGHSIGNLIAVTRGVDAGDRVVVSGATLVDDGQRVRVLP